MFVLGTAGHVDHGKSALIRALTGIDPDRLREEKERAMTIDLGFAWLKLPGGREIGIVDVPGHEHFIKNMLAGVGSIDLALLVVAANDGVMPQTREHLAILDLLGIKNGLVAVTKKDLVDAEWLDLAIMEIEDLIKPTSLASSPIVAVSALTGEGLPELVSTIDRLLESIEPRKDTGRPRLPIDRIFAIAGAGTVVTGTLIDGSLSRGQAVELVPDRIKTRLRELQTHKAHIDIAAPGSRVAANIVGVATSQLKRGDVLTSPGWLKPTTLLDGKIHLLPSVSRPLRHNATVSFHTGTAEVTAKVRLLETDELKPGETGWAQFALKSPVATVKGDHFIIRSPMATLGGGTVIDPHVSRHRRLRPAVIESLEAKEKDTPQDIIMTTLEKGQPLTEVDLKKLSELASEEFGTVIGELVQLNNVVEIGQGEDHLFFTSGGWERLVDKISGLVKDYHRKYPTRPGMPRAELSSRIKLTVQQFNSVREHLLRTDILAEAGANLRLPSFKIQLTREQQAKIDNFLKSLSQNPHTPPGDLIPEPDLLNMLVEQGRVVKVSGTVVFDTATYTEMEHKIVAYTRERGKITLAEVRDMFHTSRKYAQALLEYLDEKQVTRRIGDERVLK